MLMTSYICNVVVALLLIVFCNRHLAQQQLVGTAVAAPSPEDDDIVTTAGVDILLYLSEVNRLVGQDLLWTWYQPQRGQYHALTVDVVEQVLTASPLLSFNIYPIASGLCNELLLDAKDEEVARLRCMAAALSTLRWKTVLAISQLAELFDGEMHQEVIYPLLYAYDTSEHDASEHDASEHDASSSVRIEEEVATVCVLGTPTAHSLLPILLSPRYQQVYVFNKAFDLLDDDEDASTENFNDAGGKCWLHARPWNYFYANEVAQSRDKSISYLGISPLAELMKLTGAEEDVDESYAHICDVIQIQPDFSIREVLATSSAVLEGDEDNRLLIELLHQLSRQDVVSNHSLARIIWLDVGCYHKGLASHFDEVMRSTWFHGTAVHERQDSDGFFYFDGFQYTNVNQLPHIQHVIIAYLAPPKSEQSVADTCSNGSNESLMIVITANARNLQDNTFGLQHQLRQLGYHNVHILPELTLSWIESHRQYQLIHIAITTFHPALFIPQSIYYNVEQTFASGVFTSGAMRILQLAQHYPIWTFYEENQQFMLEQLNIISSLVSFVYDAATTSESLLQGATNSLRQVLRLEQDNYPLVFDQRLLILFIGACSERRGDLLTSLIARLSQSRIHHQVFFPNVCGQMYYDNAKDYLFHKAFIVVNLQRTDQSILEVHRINQLLPLGKVIISESGIDSTISTAYQEAIVLVDTVEVMVEKIVEFVENHDIWEAQSKRAYQKHKDLSKQNLQELQSALLKALSKFVICI